MGKNRITLDVCDSDAVYQVIDPYDRVLASFNVSEYTQADEGTDEYISGLIAACDNARLLAYGKQLRDTLNALVKVVRLPKGVDAEKFAALWNEAHQVLQETAGYYERTHPSKTPACPVSE